MYKYSQVLKSSLSIIFMALAVSIFSQSEYDCYFYSNNEFSKIIKDQKIIRSSRYSNVHNINYSASLKAIGETLYNEKGLIIKEVEFFKSSSDTMSIFEHKYDSLARIIQTKGRLFIEGSKPDTYICENYHYSTSNELEKRIFYQGVKSPGKLSADDLETQTQFGCPTFNVLTPEHEMKFVEVKELKLFHKISQEELYTLKNGELLKFWNNVSIEKILIFNEIGQLIKRISVSSEGLDNSISYQYSNGLIQSTSETVNFGIRINTSTNYEYHKN